MNLRGLCLALVACCCLAQVVVPRGTKLRIEAAEKGAWTARAAVLTSGSVVIANGATVDITGGTVQAVDGTLIPIKCDEGAKIRACTTAADHAITAPSRESMRETVTQPTSVVESAGSNSGETSLMVVANESGASVEVDRKYMGDAPLTVTVRPGKHRVIVRGNGKVWVRTVEVPFGAKIRINAELHPQ